MSEPVFNEEDHRQPSRRTLLTVVLAAPVLTVATGVTVAEEAAAAALPASGSIPEYVDFGDIMIVAGSPTTPLMRLTVTTAGRARFELPRAEVGQGITTAMAMLVAEELDLPVARVDVLLSDARPELLFNQFTGSSNSIRSLYGPVRRLGAAARARLVAAAAARWSLDPRTLTVVDGVVRAPDGRTATYADLTKAASSSTLLLSTAAPKPESQHRVVGRPTTRIDARAIVTGSLEYALDLQVEGALPAMIRRPPTIRGTVGSVQNEAEVRAMPGVVDVIPMTEGVGVIAETMGQAWAAKDALRVTWVGGPVAGVDDADIESALRAATPGLGPKPLLGTSVDAEFDFSFVPHAPLETNAAVARFVDGRMEVWTACQAPIAAQKAIAADLRLVPSQVTVHVTQGGGSFGRRLFFDGALDAARLAKRSGRAVRLMWTRIDDMRHGRARPASHHKLRATIHLGKISSYTHRMGCVETDFGHGLGEAVTAAAASIPGIGTMSVPQLYFTTSVGVPYHMGLVRQTLHEVPLKMNTGSWRSVYSGPARSSEEILLDRLAVAMRKDPVALRLEILKSERAKKVLRRAAELGQWGRSMPAGFAQGIAVHEEYRSCAAVLVEIDVRNRADPSVSRATIVVDAGRPINPKGLQAQMLGGLTDGITIALRGGLHIRDGLPLEGSYSQFHYPRIRNTPVSAQVEVVPSTAEPGGAGELAVPASVAAVASAYARATGTTVRRFPVIFPVDFTPFPTDPPEEG